MPQDDTNRRVAEACGFRIATQHGDFQEPIINIWSGEKWNHFDPLHDARDAVIAAEKIGLFMHHRDWHMTGILLPGGGTGWAVWENGDVIAEGTFCQAICAAILRLASKPSGQ